MKKMAKLAALLAAMVLAAGFSACQKKASAEESGATGTEKAAKNSSGVAEAAKPTPVNEFRRELTEDGNGVVILKYNGSAKNVVIPSEIEGLPVKVIGEEAFDENKTLKSVTIPDSVQEIGEHAFYNCTSLQSVSIPDSVKEIGEYTFNGCSALQSVTIPDSVEEIVAGAFCGCTALKSVTLGNSVREIGPFAFKGCTSLQSLTIPDSLQKIKFGDSSVFENTELPLATQARLKALGYTSSF